MIENAYIEKQNERRLRRKQLAIMVVKQWKNFAFPAFANLRSKKHYRNYQSIKAFQKWIQWYLNRKENRLLEVGSSDVRKLWLYREIVVKWSNLCIIKSKFKILDSYSSALNKWNYKHFFHRWYKEINYKRNLQQYLPLSNHLKQRMFCRWKNLIATSKRNMAVTACVLRHWMIYMQQKALKIWIKHMKEVSQRKAHARVGDERNDRTVIGLRIALRRMLSIFCKNLECKDLCATGVIHFSRVIALSALMNWNRYTKRRAISRASVKQSLRNMNVHFLGNIIGKWKGRNNLIGQQKLEVINFLEIASIHHLKIQWERWLLYHSSQSNLLLITSKSVQFWAQFRFKHSTHIWQKFGIDSDRKNIIEEIRNAVIKAKCSYRLYVLNNAFKKFRNLLFKSNICIYHQKLASTFCRHVKLTRLFSTWGYNLQFMQISKSAYTQSKKPIDRLKLRKIIAFWCHWRKYQIRKKIISFPLLKSVFNAWKTYAHDKHKKKLRYISLDDYWNQNSLEKSLLRWSVYSSYSRQNFARIEITRIKAKKNICKRNIGHWRNMTQIAVRHSYIMHASQLHSKTLRISNGFEKFLSNYQDRQLLLINMETAINHEHFILRKKYFCKWQMLSENFSLFRTVTKAKTSNTYLIVHIRRAFEVWVEHHRSTMVQNVVELRACVHAHRSLMRYMFRAWKLYISDRRLEKLKHQRALGYRYISLERRVFKAILKYTKECAAYKRKVSTALTFWKLSLERLVWQGLKQYWLYKKKKRHDIDSALNMRRLSLLREGGMRWVSGSDTLVSNRVNRVIENKANSERRKWELASKYARKWLSTVRARRLSKQIKHTNFQTSINQDSGYLNQIGFNFVQPLCSEQKVFQNVPKKIAPSFSPEISKTVRNIDYDRRGRLQPKRPFEMLIQDSNSVQVSNWIVQEMNRKHPIHTGGIVFAPPDYPISPIVPKPVPNDSSYLSNFCEPHTKASNVATKLKAYDSNEEDSVSKSIQQELSNSLEIKVQKLESDLFEWNHRVAKWKADKVALKALLNVINDSVMMDDDTRVELAAQADLIHCRIQEFSVWKMSRVPALLDLQNEVNETAAKYIR